MKTVAFDKTGTLTVGRPKLLAVTPVAGVSRAEVLAIAAGVEALSAHPLAKAIVDGAAAEQVKPLAASGAEAVHGRGLHAQVEGAKVSIGNAALFEGTALPAEISAAVDQLEEAGQTTMIVRRGEQFLGVLGVADTVRSGARHALAQLTAAASPAR